MADRPAPRTCLASACMDAPPPSAAFAISDRLHELAGAVEAAGAALSAARAAVRTDWQGKAADAASTLLSDLTRGAQEAQHALVQASTTWNHLAHDLQANQRRMTEVDAINAGFNGFALVSAVQLGLDPFTDAAAVAARAAAATALAAARAMLRHALERAVARVLVDRTLLGAVRVAGAYVAKSVAVNTGVTTLSEQYEYGSVSWARLAGPAQLVADLTPRAVLGARELVPPNVYLPAPVPPGFADAGAYDAARVAAADWGARSVPGTAVSVDAGPDGTARVTIHGASAPLQAGRVYRAAEVAPLDRDLSRTLGRVAAHADVPVTVVAER